MSRTFQVGDLLPRLRHTDLSGEVGLEGTAWVSKITGKTADGRLVSTAGAGAS